jgi:hypothetical protein
MATATRVKDVVTAPSARRAVLRQPNDPPEPDVTTVPRAEIHRNELPDPSALRVLRVPNAHHALSARLAHHGDHEASTPTT